MQYEKRPFGSWQFHVRVVYHSLIRVDDLQVVLLGKVVRPWQWIQSSASRAQAAATHILDQTSHGNKKREVGRGSLNRGSGQDLGDFLLRK